MYFCSQNIGYKPDILTANRPLTVTLFRPALEPGLLCVLAGFPSAFLRCIKELLKTAQEITELYNNGKKLGLSQEELAFYDALTKPENIKDFYRNNELIDLTRELTEMRRKNRTIDWQKKETARASMRKMVKHLLKKYKYPPEDYDTAISTVISQCEMWADNITA